MAFFHAGISRLNIGALQIELALFKTWNNRSWRTPALAESGKLART